MSDLKLDLKGAFRQVFGKCPNCNTRLTAGRWLKWCPKKGCSWVGPK